MDLARELNTTPEIGLHLGVSEADYRGWSALNASWLKQLAKSPAHLLEYMGNPPETTDAQAFGIAAHCAVLTPELFQEQYFKRPPGVARATPKVKEQWAKEHPGKTCLKKAEWDACWNIASALESHATASQFLSTAKIREASFVWKDNRAGLLCKGRADAVSEAFSAVIDIKTTDDATPHAFGRTIYKFGYHIQAAHYMAGMWALGKEIEHFILIAVEKSAPHSACVYSLDSEVLDYASELRDGLLETYKECTERGFWPGYDESIQHVHLPKWVAENQQNI